MKSSFSGGKWRVGRWHAMAALSGILLTAGGAHAASFDCRKAAAKLEKTICGDAELSGLDSALAEAYKNAPRVSGVPADKLLSEQRRWIKEVRNRCSDVECFKKAYGDRIAALGGDAASFDCRRASSAMEKLICSDNGLRRADHELAANYEALRAVSGDWQREVNEQKAWLADLEKGCVTVASVACMRDAYVERSQVLEEERKEAVQRLTEDIGYRKAVFYSDFRLWPKHAGRTIAVFATQESAGNDQHSQAQPDEDYLLDIFVIDTATHKVLARGSDSVSSDAIALSGVSIDTSDYSAKLGMPVFGLNFTHWHYGCAGFGSSSLELFTVKGKTVKTVLPLLSTSISTSMCGTDCESSSTTREIEFPGAAAQPHPDLTVREKKEESEADPAAKDGSCKTATSAQEFKLRFKGEHYELPEGLRW